MKLSAAGASCSEIFHSECENEESNTRERVIDDQNGGTAPGVAGIFQRSPVHAGRKDNRMQIRLC